MHSTPTDPPRSSNDSVTLTNNSHDNSGVEISFDSGGQLTGDPSGVTCPNCRQELAIGQLSGAQFAGCSGCYGMLFQQDTFGMLIQHLRAKRQHSGIIPNPLDFRQLEIRRSCPACLGTMETHAYGGPGNAVIDTCFPCKLIFLDHGELQKLVDAPGRT